MAQQNREGAIMWKSSFSLGNIGDEGFKRDFRKQGKGNYVIIII